MIDDDTPILETVFVTYADDATDIGDVFNALGAVLPNWATVPLSYVELLELAGDVATGTADTDWMAA